MNAMLKTDPLVAAVIGHFVGDYLLQTKRMALGKTKLGIYGIGLCTAHVGVYSAAVCAVIWTANMLLFALVFIPHWIIDRWSLAGLWLKAIGGRTFDTVSDQNREWDIAFTAIVYTVTDNTMHVLCLWAALAYLN